MQVLSREPESIFPTLLSGFALLFIRLPGFSPRYGSFPYHMSNSAEQSHLPSLSVVTTENTTLETLPDAYRLTVRRQGAFSETRFLGDKGTFELFLPAPCIVSCKVENLYRFQETLIFQASLSDENRPILDASNATARTGIVLDPGESGRLELRLPPATMPGKPACPGANPQAHTIRLTALSFLIQATDARSSELAGDFRLSDFRVHPLPGSAPKLPNPPWETPFIDEFGQYDQLDWPEKVKSAAELPEDLARELPSLRPAPGNWDAFGGWATGPRHEATGHFRVEKIDGKWWFVDPCGNLFFSYGIDTLRHYTDRANGRLHPDWFRTPVPKNGWMSFTHWNLQKKFGEEDYVARYYDFILRRLDTWGVNTIGRWAAHKLTLYGRKPYLILLYDTAPKVPMVKGTDFYDCFHPEFPDRMLEAIQMQKREESVAHSLEDPMCLGYCVDNEKDFAGIVDKLLAQSYRTCPTKAEFLRDVRLRHLTLSALNAAWGTHFRVWEEFAELCRPVPGEGYRADAVLFRRKWLDRYFRICRQAVKSLSPQKLFFACAFKGFRQPPDVWETAASYADVLSINIHAYGTAQFVPRGDGGRIVDKPILVGAFNFGCADRGMGSGGPTPCPNQTERARTFRRFVQGAMQNPHIVGCHYFQYRDQPLVGRGDGEAYQIGFVDGCDRPYPEMIKASRIIGENLYPESTRYTRTLPYRRYDEPLP